MTQSIFLEEIKSNSSRWIKIKGEQYKKFTWQRGYGLFSVSSSQLNIVSNGTGYGKRAMAGFKLIRLLQF